MTWAARQENLVRQRVALPHSGIRADGAYSVPSGDSFLIKRSIFLSRGELNIAYAYFYPELLVNLQVRYVWNRAASSLEIFPHQAIQVLEFVHQTRSVEKQAGLLSRN